MRDPNRAPGPWLRSIESWAAALSVLVLGLMPIVQIVVRLVADRGIPGYNAYLAHLVLMAAFLGGMITAREGRHLAIRVAVDAFPESLRAIADTVAAFLSTTIGFGFFWSSISFAAIGFEPGM
ncbi:MAG: TRAP transporter small permease, partial [Spirochaetota bacterium]